MKALEKGNLSTAGKRSVHTVSVVRIFFSTVQYFIQICASAHISLVATCSCLVPTINSGMSNSEVEITAELIVFMQA